MRRRGQRSRWAPLLALVLTVAAGAAVATGCSDGPDQQSCEEHQDCPADRVCSFEQGLCVDGEEAGCEADEDCPEGWICDEDGACVEAAGLACESAFDCPGDGTYVCGDGGECVEDVVTDEAYDISFSAEHDRDEETEIVQSTRDGEISEVDTGDIDCHEARACQLTSDGDHLIAIVENGDNHDAIVAPVSGDPPAVEGAGEVFAEEIQSPRLRGDGVAFERTEDGRQTARFQRHDGDEQEVASLHDPDAQLEHSWDVDPVSGRTMQFVPPDLNSLDVRVGTVGEAIPSDEELTRLDGSSAGDGLGSFFLTNIPATASEDGRFVAFTVSGLNDYQNCETHDDCTGTSHKCGENGRCFAIEETVYVADMDYADNLGQECLSHDECGPVHRCDSGAEDFDGGQCQVQRIVVGLPDTPRQPRGVDGQESKTGCEATRDDGTFGFTDVQDPLAFGPDDRVYFVGYRGCTRSPADDDDDVEANIPRTSIVAADPFTGEHEELFGNFDGDDYDARGCSQQGDLAEDMSECNLVFEDLRFSPQQNDFVLRASNPAVSSSLADDVMDVWNLRRDGDRIRWIGGLTGSEQADDVAVHGNDGGDE